eukprot:2412553-Pleurochrysis_carterae.AAC.1
MKPKQASGLARAEFVCMCLCACALRLQTPTRVSQDEVSAQIPITHYLLTKCVARDLSICNLLNCLQGASYLAPSADFLCSVF